MEEKRKFKIGGIRNKLFTLILITLALITLAFFIVVAYQSKTLRTLSAETSRKQLQSIGEITDSVMAADIKDNLERITKLEALSTDEIFRDAASRVKLLARFAERIYKSRSGSMTMQPYNGPDPAMDGQLYAQVIFADDADPSDPKVQEAIGLTANLSNMMLNICRIFNSDNIYIALPEGAFLSVSRNSASWFEPDGSLMSYDARERFWYKQAVEAGDLIFTDVETDANTGNLSLVCAMPAYGSTGELRAVIGTDLFLNTMQEAMESVKQEGGYYLIINRDGHVISSTLEDDEAQEQVSHDAPDLREATNTELADFIRSAMEGDTESRLVHLGSGAYYMTGKTVDTVGWTLVSSLSEAVATRSITMLERGMRNIAEEASEQYDEKTDNTKLMVLAALGILFVILSGAALLQGRKIVKPLNTMTKRISEMGEDDIEFKMQDTYRTGDEIELLADSFARLSRKTISYVDQVRKATAEKERLGAELDMAAMIQNSELPHTFPAFPDRHEFDLYASMSPAKQVGGDFYDYFLIDDDHLCIIIADVSGKGIPGALFMMTTKVILKNCAMMGRNPEEILKSANDTICKNNQAGMFVSVWTGIIEISTGKLSAANAGHEYPALKTGEGRFILFKDKHGLVLGAMDGVKHTQYELQLCPGDKLFLYTDGVPEATDAQNELFGTDRMIEALNRNAEAGPKEITENVRKAVDEFVQDAEQFDDLTMVCFEYKG